MSGMAEEPRSMTIRNIYRNSDLMYIKYDGEDEKTPICQGQITGHRLTFNQINENRLW